MIFFKKVEEGNNNSDIDIDNFFIKVSDVFSESEARQLFDYILIEYTINTGNVEFLYRFIYNLSVNELSIFRDNLEEFLEKGYI